MRHGSARVAGHPYTLWYGRSAPPEPVRNLRAGAYTMLLDGADLRYVRYDDLEIVRRLYFAVRDHNWNTIPFSVVRSDVTESESGFVLKLAARCDQGGIRFGWTATVTGDASAGITYAFEGAAESAFAYNRIGFCVLHPPDATVGRAYSGIAASGATLRGTFPETIGEQSLVDGVEAALFAPVSALRIDTERGAISFAFEGDVFETEDQRNWTDDSFKTYCTPLSTPWPRKATVGQTIRQRVRCVMEAPRVAVPAVPFAVDGLLPVNIVVLTEPRGLPGLGVEIAAEPLAQSDIDRIAALSLSHLRLSLDLSDLNRLNRADAALRRAISVIGALPDTGLELALSVSDDADVALDVLAKLLADFGDSARVRRFLVFHGGEEATRANASWVRLARERLAPVCEGAEFFGGTDQYFCQINRARFDADATDGVAYSINGQTHAFDERSLAESIVAQSATVQSARATFAERLPICISPITLKPRFNPNATRPDNEDGFELPRSVDVRQMSLFAGAWTLASIAALTEAGTDHITYYETHGMRGILAGQHAVFPALFPAERDTVFPGYHVLADLGALRGGASRVCATSSPLSVRAIAGQTLSGDAILLAGNLTYVTQTVRLDVSALPRSAGAAITCRRLNDRTDVTARYTPEEFRASEEPVTFEEDRLELELSPFESVRLDWRRR